MVQKPTFLSWFMFNELLYYSWCSGATLLVSVADWPDGALEAIVFSVAGLMYCIWCSWQKCYFIVADWPVGVDMTWFVLILLLICLPIRVPCEDWITNVEIFVDPPAGEDTATSWNVSPKIGLWIDEAEKKSAKWHIRNAIKFILVLNRA